VPKQEYVLQGFHGGINNNSDPKDIQDIEFREADGVSIHELGRLTSIGNLNSALANLSGAAADIEPGYGLHYFSTDYDNAEANNSEDWLAIYNKGSSHKVRFYYRDKDGNSPDFTSSGNEVVMGSGTKPNFYYADGFLRIGDASHTNVSQYFGYIDSNLFWTGSSGQSANLHDIHKWKHGHQKLKGFDSILGDVDRMVLFNANNASPEDGTGTTNIHQTEKKLFLTYWTNDGGDWNGIYEFAATPVYLGNQEGEISTFKSNLSNISTAHFYNQEVVFQVFIPTGEDSNSGITPDADHRLGDDRIIGVNFYFRKQGDEDWTFLMNTDLIEGGKHYWKLYNSDTETNYGYWTGAEVTPSAGGSSQTVFEGIDILENSATNNTHIAFSDASGGNGMNWEGTGSASTQKGKSYFNVYLRVKLSNTNVNGFSGRFGFLRIWGGANSPLYVATVSGAQIPLLTGQAGTPGTDYDTYYIPMALPGLGTDREFRVELLDENFTVIADSGIKTMSIEDSGKAAPEDFEQTVEIG